MWDCISVPNIRGHLDQISPRVTKAFSSNSGLQTREQTQSRKGMFFFFFFFLPYLLFRKSNIFLQHLKRVNNQEHAAGRAGKGPENMGVRQGNGQMLARWFPTCKGGWWGLLHLSWGRGLQPVCVCILSWDKAVARIPSQCFAMMLQVWPARTGIVCLQRRIPLNFFLRALRLTVEKSHPAGLQRACHHGCLGPPRWHWAGGTSKVTLGWGTVQGLAEMCVTPPGGILGTSLCLWYINKDHEPFFQMLIKFLFWWKETKRGEETLSWDQKHHLSKVRIKPEIAQNLGMTSFIREMASSSRK